VQGIVLLRKGQESMPALKAVIACIDELNQPGNLPPGVQDPASSVLKLKGTELAQAATEILMEVAGANAMAWQSEQLWGTAAEEPIGPEWAATVAPDYFYTRAASIYGGSNEIQRNVIAKRILGL